MKKNFLYNFVYQIFTVLLPLITAPYLSRVIGAKGIGEYTYTFTIAQYFCYFALLGVSNYGTRTVAESTENEKNEAFVGIYSVQFLTSFFVFIIYLLFCIIFNTKYVVITQIQAIYVLSSCLDISWYFFGTERFKTTTMRNCIAKIGALFFIFIFVKTFDDIWKYTLIMSLSFLLSQLSMWGLIFREVRLQPVTILQMWHHFKMMIILFIPVFAVAVYTMLNKIILGAMSDVSQVGYYNAAEQIVRLPSLLVAALGTSMLPRMAKLNATGKSDDIAKEFNMSSDFTGFVIFGSAFGISAVSNVLVPIFYGEGFSYSTQLLRLLPLSLLFSAWASLIRTQYLIPLKRDKEYIVSVICGAFLNIILCVILIPLFQGQGAVYAAIASEACVAIIQTAMVSRSIDIWRSLKTYAKYLPSSILMWIIVTFYLHTAQISLRSLVAAIFLGLFCYLAVFFFASIKKPSPVAKYCKTIFENYRHKFSDNGARK